jgi:hypothetical protein
MTDNLDDYIDNVVYEKSSAYERCTRLEENKEVPYEWQEDDAGWIVAIEDEPQNKRYRYWFQAAYAVRLHLLPRSMMVVWNEIDYRLAEHMLAATMQVGIDPRSGKKISELQARAIVTKALLNMIEVRDN